MSMNCTIIVNLTSGATDAAVFGVLVMGRRRFTDAFLYFPWDSGLRHPSQSELDGYLPWSDASIIGKMKPVRNSSTKHSRAWKSLRMLSHMLAAIAGRVMDFMCAIAVYPPMPLPKIATPGAANPTAHCDVAQADIRLSHDRKGTPSPSRKSRARNQEIRRSWKSMLCR